MQNPAISRMNQPEYWWGGESVDHAGEYCGWWNERVGYIAKAILTERSGTDVMTNSCSRYAVVSHHQRGISPSSASDR